MKAEGSASDSRVVPRESTCWETCGVTCSTSACDHESSRTGMLLDGLVWSTDEAPVKAAPPVKEPVIKEPAGRPVVDTDAPAVDTDGGASYRAAALRRAIDEARTTGVSLEEVVARRWGSIDELTRGDSEAFKKAPPQRPPRARPAPRDVPPKSLPIGDGSADRDILRQYSRKLETAFGEAFAGKRVIEAAPPKPEDQNAWVGLGRSTLGMSGTCAKGWRRGAARDDDDDDAQESSRSRKRPLVEEEDGSRRRPPTSNSSAAAALRASLEGARRDGKLSSQ